MDNSELVKGLRDAARRYKMKADLLSKAADALESPEASNPIGPALVPGLFDKRTKKNDVVAYLLEHGPTWRRDLVRNGGFKLGTLATVLIDTNVFTQLADGKWALLDQKPKEEAQKAE